MTTHVSRFGMVGAVMLAAALGGGCRQAGSGAPPAPPVAKETAPQVKTPHSFRGKVEKVETDRKMLTVNGEDVPGWMGPMTMVYEVDKEDVLARVAVGDEITATVYDGDLKTLHDITVTRKATAR